MNPELPDIYISDAERFEAREDFEAGADSDPYDHDDFGGAFDGHSVVSDSDSGL